MRERKVDILIVGGGVGGCAAAVAAASLGRSVILTEETDWLGGQLTSQAVPPDEHPWIEYYGCTRRYRRFRDQVRQYYRDHYPFKPQVLSDAHFNPGQGGVSRLCHEPKVALEVIRGMLAPYCSSGRLTILLRHKPLKVELHGDKIGVVTLKNLQTGDQIHLAASYILDATELGELLPLANVEYVTGAESQADTQEPHAVSGPAQPDNVQAMTWCFPVAFDPREGVDHTINKPQQYNRWREYIPEVSPPWAGKLLSWQAPHPRTLMPRKYHLMPDQSDPNVFSLWSYRRVIYQGHYQDGFPPHDATLVNWPQNDYFCDNIIDKPQPQVDQYFHDARQLSLSWLYWLQTEAPRPEGGYGYPQLYLRSDMVDTEDGLAKYPYIRESRRIKAVFTVTENHLSTAVRTDLKKSSLEDKVMAEPFPDSVGVGAYRIDLHPSTGGDNYIDISSLPFQIPLGSLIPIRMENLLPACKNLGVTHITNGCYRLHPVEWNIGESSGLLAAFCLQNHIRPKAVREKKELLCDFQNLLTNQGVELSWPDNIPPL